MYHKDSVEMHVLILKDRMEREERDGWENVNE